MKTLKQLLGWACFALMLGMRSPAAATNYQDWWWNPTITGAGINIGQQGDIIAAAWYLFDASGHPTFLTFAGQLVGNQVSGDLYRTQVSGGVTTTSVGSATFTFTSDITAVLNYNYDGGSGSINLQRFTFAAADLENAYDLFFVDTLTGCLNPALNGTLAYQSYGSLLLTTGNDLTLSLVHPLGTATATLEANYSQAGSVSQGSGTWSTSTGDAGTWSFQNLRVIDGFISSKISTQSNITGCHEEISMTGIAAD
jgi:hypothetical protein